MELEDQFQLLLFGRIFKLKEVKNNNEAFDNKPFRIFISHSSKDRKIVKHFKEKILQLGLKLDADEIFCTSVDDTGIKSGDDFPLEIKRNIKNSTFIILIITDNYKKSEMCLNEMGAAWILDTKVIPFVLDPINYNNVGLAFNSTQILKLNNRSDLMNFRDHHIEDLNRPDFKTGNYSDQIDSFLNVFNEQQTEQHTVEILKTKDNKEEYFKKYLIADTNIPGLLQKAQPTLSDCQAIFNDLYFEDIYYLSSLLNGRLYEERGINNSLLSLDSFNVREIPKKEFDNPNEIWMNFYSSLRISTKLYSVNFKSKDSEYGTRFNFWAYVNGRWVFFNKPQKLIRLIDSIKYDPDLERIVKILKRFGIGRNLKQVDIDFDFFIYTLFKKLKQ